MKKLNNTLKHTLTLFSFFENYFIFNSLIEISFIVSYSVCLYHIFIFSFEVYFLIFIDSMNMILSL